MFVGSSVMKVGVSVIGLTVVSFCVGELVSYDMSNISQLSLLS